MTLARATIDVRRSGIFLLREARGLPAAMPATDGLLWDGRRRIILHDRTDPVSVAPAGDEAARLVAGLPSQCVPQSLVHAALAAEPTVWRGGQCLGWQGAGVVIEPVVASFARFLPGFDLEPAQALAPSAFACQRLRAAFRSQRPAG